MLQPEDFSRLKDNVEDVVSQLKTQLHLQDLKNLTNPSAYEVIMRKHLEIWFSMKTGLETKPNVDSESIILQDLPDLEVPDVGTLVSGALHRLSLPMSYILAGHTNAGKTSVARQLFLDVAVSFRYGDEVLAVGDCADMTRSLVQIPFGRGENQEGERLMLFDTPGLESDDIYLRNIAHAALGLEQIGSDEEKLTSIPMISLGLPDKDGVADVVFEEQIPLEKLNSILNRDQLGCIYVAKATETPLHKDVLKENLVNMRKHYGERLVTALTFEDELEEWPKMSQERRRKLLDEALPEDFTSINGVTGDGKSSLTHRLLLAQGYAPTSLLTHLCVETRCSRLFYASDQIAAIVAAALLSDAVNSSPSEHLLPVILLVGGMAIHIIYGLTEDKWQEFSGNAEKLKGAMEGSFVEKESSTYYTTRMPQGFLENVASFFGKKHTVLRQRTTEVVRVSPEVLATFYNFLYACIYDLEAESEPKVLSTTKIPEEEAIKRFKDLFELHKALLETRDALQLYRIGSQVLSKFWEKHHPEVLPNERTSSLEMDKI